MMCQNAISHHYALIFYLKKIFRADPVAHGGSQVRGLIGATGANLYHSHSNVGSSCVCDLHHSLWQHWILNPLSEARDRTHILMDVNWVCFHWATTENPFKRKVRVMRGNRAQWLKVQPLESHCPGLNPVSSNTYVTIGIWLNFLCLGLSLKWAY